MSRSAFGAKASGLRKERVHASPRFVDGAFRNTKPVAPGLKPGTTWSTMGEYFRGGAERAPPRPLPSESPLERWQRPPETGLRATWLGHSTVLLEIDGHRILTDPVWGPRASPTPFAGPKRFQPVPVAIRELPPLDAVVISHDHYDHLDLPSILGLLPLDVPFYTSLGVGAHLEAWGVPASRIVELDWWESARLPAGELEFTALPAQHFSGRFLGDRNHTAWSAFGMKTRRHRVFFSGDTGLTEEYEEIRERFGRPDLVLLEIGAYHPSWGDIHLGPDNAVVAHRLLGGRHLLPVHWGTFNLALHAWDEPAQVIAQRARVEQVSLLMPKLGVPIEPERTPPLEEWWASLSARR